MSGIKDGILDIQLSSWQYFHDFISKKMLDYNHYVWRGDRCDDRPLLPTFDRNHKSKNRKTIEGLAIKHLQTFKLATRGRRGTSPSKIETENDWWALGQHYGLTTPLLDWTRSPFVALFFALKKTKLPKQVIELFTLLPLPLVNEKQKRLQITIKLQTDQTLSSFLLHRKTRTIDL